MFGVGRVLFGRVLVGPDVITSHIKQCGASVRMRVELRILAGVRSLFPFPVPSSSGPVLVSRGDCAFIRDSTVTDRTHPYGGYGYHDGYARAERPAPARPDPATVRLSCLRAARVYNLCAIPPTCGLKTGQHSTELIRDHTRHKASALRSIPPPQPASLRLRPPWLWAQCRKPRRPPHPSPQVRGACAVHPCRPCQSTIQSHLIESQTAHLARKGCCTMCESGALKRA